MKWNGRTIRHLRERLDMDRERLARVLGNTVQDIRTMEQPHYRPTRSIADALDRLHDRALRQGL